MWTTSRGNLSAPNYWPEEPVYFAEKRVGIIGSGATAVQLIPEIADKVGELAVFQRRPNWYAPLHNGLIDKAAMAEIKASYNGIFARCLETPGGFFHGLDRRSLGKLARMIAWNFGGAE